MTQLVDAFLVVFAWWSQGVALGVGMGMGLLVVVAAARIVMGHDD